MTDNIDVFSLSALDLAALLCSRVCHDVISPVGAIVNGLEVLEDEKDADMREFAIELIKKSARTASARLQFCRLAFGAAGSAGASIDTGDAENVARGLLAIGIVVSGVAGGRKDGLTTALFVFCAYTFVFVIRLFSGPPPPRSDS